MSAESKSLADEFVARYLRNLELLYVRAPSLAARVDALPFSELPPLEAARDGGWTARLQADDGRELFAHSRYNPTEEARRFVASHAPQNALTFILHGLGLGYHLAALEAAVDQPVTFVVEDNLALIKATLALHDLSAPLGDGRLIFLTDASKTAVHETLKNCNADLMLGVHSLTTPLAGRRGAAFHEQARAALLDCLSVAKTHMVTLLRTARVTFENIAMNLPAYLDNAGVEALRDRAAGYPAIVVAAGPSLARNIRRLPALADRAVIISVQTVFKLLHALGVQPHFVTSLDFHDVSTEFFRGLTDVGRSTLVAEPKAAWKVIDLFAGAKRVLRHRFADQLLGPAAPQRGELPPGSTVAHLAFYLAEYLGCDPIIFVGQDLAFTDGLFYLPGSPIEQIWSPELGRFQTLEMKQWERIARNRPILRRLTDATGAAAYSDDLLFTYRDQFERDFAGCKRRIIQASEGGLSLRGAEPMTLADAADRFCTQPLPPDLLPPPSSDASSRAPAVAALHSRIDEIREVRDVSEQTAAALREMSELVDRPAEFNRVVARVDALRTRMARLHATYQLVCDVSPVAQLRRYAADRRLGKVASETPEIARRRLGRDIEFVAAFLDGCDFLLRILPHALQRLEAAP